MNGTNVADNRVSSLVGELHQLETRVRSKLYGRVAGFRLDWRGKGLVLLGFAHSFHAKQLAQHAVMEATEWPITANEIEVI